MLLTNNAYFKRYDNLEYELFMKIGFGQFGEMKGPKDYDRINRKPN